MMFPQLIGYGDSGSPERYSGQEDFEPEYVPGLDQVKQGLHRACFWSLFH